MIKRDLAAKLRLLAGQFPAVSLMGPRQSGKTTLARETFPDYRYFSFEDPDVRERVMEDPRGFLLYYKDEPGVIFDEIQHVPPLFSYMQTHIDLHKKMGHFIIIGSQNLLLNERITQSLAGRIALLTLLPLSLHELKEADKLPPTIDETLFRGQYPGLYTDDLSIGDWYRSYINSYIERDVRQLQHVQDLSSFQRFLRLCAGRIGQIVNLTSLANDTGMSTHAIKQWLSILEASYIIFLLRPYFGNYGKRLIKSPKIYFYDTGLACSLLSLSSTEHLFLSPFRGNIFESFIIADLMKQRFNQSLNPNIYFWQDKTGFEIDSILEHGMQLTPIEIKVSQTFNTRFLKAFSAWNNLTKTESAQNIVVYGGDTTEQTASGRLVSWRDAGTLNSSNN